MKHGVLLLNLGTPSKPTIPSVSRYLASFLLDPRVVDLPPFIRYPLVLGAIIPLRARASTHAYQSIWDDEKGSPLRFHTEAVVQALQKDLGEAFDVRYAMRYGTPSIQSTIEDMAGHCERISVLPLFPQYASSSSGSAIAKTMEVMSKLNAIPDVHICSDYFSHSSYINALAHVTQENAGSQKADHWLMSFHGLPVRHIEHSCNMPCKQMQSCPSMQKDNRRCYRAQCYQTARDLSTALGIKESDYTVAFQSRLGKTPWIKPYTDETLKSLREKGVKNIRILCPSFPIDCLETIEEIGMAGKTTWQQLGGESYDLIPCLNAHPTWIAFLKQLVLEFCSIQGRSPIKQNPTTNKED